MNCSFSRSIAPQTLLCLVIVAGATPAFAQNRPNGKNQKNLTIEPYKGKPIFLDEGEAPPEPRIVQPRTTMTDKYEDGKPRIEREVAKYSDDTYVSNGVYKEYYQSGQLFVAGEFDLGARTGEWVFYHENGEVAKKVKYESGRPDGKIEVRREDGTLEAQREFNDGRRVGDWYVYADDGEQKLREAHYADGKATGVWKQWYPSGQLWRETPFKEGERHGLAKEWKPDGSKLAEVNFSAGKRDGLAVGWTAEGEKMERRFEDGKLSFE